MQTTKEFRTRQVDETYLAGCLSAFFAEALPSIQQQYNGRQFDKTILGKPLSAFGDNAFQQNLSFRQQMSEVERSARPFRKAKQAVWYVEKWGGIAARSHDTQRIKKHRKKLFRFAYSDPADLIADGTKGIASWSKVLSYRRYNDYAIYDARVAGCLNAIQIVHGRGLKYRFPAMSTDGAAAEAFQIVLNETGNSIRPIPTKQVYELYCRLLRDQWLQLSAELQAHAINWQGLEMTLFHHSPAMFGLAAAKLQRKRLYLRQLVEISTEKRKKRLEYEARKQKEASLV